MTTANRAEEIRELLIAVSEDFDVVAEEMERHDTPARRRLAVRAFVTAVDAFVVAVATACLVDHSDGGVEYTETELARLRAFAKGRTRGAERQPLHGRFSSILALYTKGVGPPLKIEHAARSALGRISSIRNRITHPTLGRHLAVSDAELQCLQHAVTWFATTAQCGS